MIRIAAGLWMKVPASDLVNQCYQSAEYLDCDCMPAYRAREAALEAELENLAPLPLPGGLVHVLARPLRSKLPRSQPHGH
jgi:hypothetical protein